MAKINVNTLADIARTLNTTPQAVSNWKARDQVPFHVVSKLKYSKHNEIENTGNAPQKNIYSNENIFSISDIFVTLAEQLKVIILLPIITTFIAFTYINFVQIPLYESSATILLPDQQNNNMGGLAGFASQFGVNMPTNARADLSSPVVLPELIRSRTFSVKILEKDFFTKKHNKKLPLINILSNKEKLLNINEEETINKALSKLGKMINFEKSSSGVFNIIKVKAFEPIFAKELAEVVIKELVELNSFFQSQTANEKTSFIEKRIYSVKTDLEESEGNLKDFNQKNRQISSPSLQLQLDRLTREVEVQKGIYLVLKQQHELAKIEEVQEGSILQVLDKPQLSLAPINKNLKLGLFVSLFFGIVLGIIIGIIRSGINGLDIDKRKKVRRGKKFINNKIKDFLVDTRILMIISLMFILGLPYYSSYKSDNPIYFGLYSNKALFIAILYILILSFSVFLLIKSISKKRELKNQKNIK